MIFHYTWKYTPDIEGEAQSRFFENRIARKLSLGNVIVDIAIQKENTKLK